MVEMRGHQGRYIDMLKVGYSESKRVEEEEEAIISIVLWSILRIENELDKN
jgi:hypothetical protein